MKPWPKGYVLIFVLVLAGCCSLFSSTYHGPKSDGAWRVEALARRDSIEAVASEARRAVASPLWTWTLETIAAVASEPGHHATLTTYQIRLANSLLILGVFLLWFWGRPASLQALSVGLISLAPMLHGALANASYDAVLALAVTTALRGAGLRGGLLAAALGISFLSWGQTSWTWDNINLYAAFGLNRQPLPSWVGALVSTGALAGALFLGSALAQRDKKREANGETRNLGLTGLGVLAVATLAPAMVRGVEWLAIPFLYEAAMRDRRLNAPLALLACLLWLDASASLGFSQIVDHFEPAMPGIQGGWTMPSYVGSVALKIGLAFWIYKRLMSEQAEAQTAFELGALRRTWQTFLDRWDAFTDVPHRHVKGVWIGVLLMTLLALVINLNELGSRKFPSTAFTKAGQVVARLAPTESVQGVWIAHVAGEVSYQVHCPGSSKARKLIRENVLSWSYFRLPTPCSDEVTISWQPSDKRGMVSEAILVDQAYSKIEPESVCEESGCVPPTESKLFDESREIPGIPLPLHGGILDEMFNAGPGAGKILDREIEPLEVTSHPYLGRWLIYQSMRYFGIGPFGWRLPSALAGALLPLLVLLLARLVLRHDGWAMFAALLSFFDFVRVGTGRTAFVDTQLSLFIILHYIFIAKALLEKRGVARTLAMLAGAWAAIGAAAACKWLGIFPLVVTLPVAAIVVGRLWRRHPPKRAAMVAAILASFIPPLLIYTLPYVPFLKDQDSFASILAHQRGMLGKHGGLRQATGSSHAESFVNTHVSAAGITDWLFDNVSVRAVLIPFGSAGKTAVYIFGNPIVWWGIGLALLALTRWRRHPLSIGVALVLAAYMAQVVPWLFIKRYSFPYHYLAAATLGTILIAHAVRQIRSPFRRRALAVAILVGACLAFATFLPTTLGIPLSEPRIASVQWFDRWFFEFRLKG